VATPGGVFDDDDDVNSPIKFGKAYVSTTKSGSDYYEEVLIFYEDGSATTIGLLNGEVEFNETAPVGTFEYSGTTVNNVNSGSVFANTSADGNTIVTDNGSFLLTYRSTVPIQFEKHYIGKNNGETNSFVFYPDGTVEFYINGQLEESEISSAFYLKYMWGAIMNDGSIEMMPLSSQNSTFYWNGIRFIREDAEL